MPLRLIFAVILSRQMSIHMGCQVFGQISVTANLFLPVVGVGDIH